MVTLEDNFGAKKGTDYICQICDFKCCKKYSWDRHLTTLKHINSQKITLDDTFGAKKGKKGQHTAFKCEFCDKEYKHRQGLWKHNQKCGLPNNEDTTEDLSESKEKINSIDKDDLILMILKQNSEILKENTELRKEQTDIKEMILEIVKNGIINNNNSHNTTNNTHTNSHNKAFNLNFFLNETCKNAMNITDFVDSIKVQLSDLMDVGEKGFVEGISKIIVKNLNDLDENVRPVHCTDKKRETMYIKDQGEWNKEDDKKTKLKKIINKVADKNIRLLPQFREKYPDYKDSSSKTSDVYDKMVIEIMDTNEDKKEKIIHNISKATIIKEK